MEAKLKYNISYNISPFLSVGITTNEEKKKIIKEVVKKILPLLPPGTKCTRCVALPVVSLCESFDIFFEHAWFKSNTLIEVTYSREAFPTHSGVDQFSLIRKVTFEADGVSY